MINKFPQLYKHAAELLKLASEEDKNVKHLLYNDRKYQFLNIKSLYAIVANSLKHSDVIETLVKESNILTEHPRLNIWRIRVVITELLFNNNNFENHENNTIQTVIKYEEKFKKILSKGQTKNLFRSNGGCAIDNVKVRYIKVNLIKENVNSVIEKFQDEGWEKLEPVASYEDYLKQLRGLKHYSQVFLQDFHIPEVLVFPPGTELQYNELYANGSIFFMDKASCLAPLLLAPDQNGHVLDMCAAPGLKTIQLASYVPKGKVYAVERDPGRYESLQQMVEQSGADNVITLLQDVTKLNVDQYKHVEYILLDPSCTGSGIQRRLPSTSLKARMDEKTRLEKLSGFQLTLLRFALTRFPAAKRVVYSTCSLNVEENEKVVEAALNSYYHDFDVVSVKDKLSEWQSFGSKDFHFGHKCVYCRTETDCTNGFFVAVFERKKVQSDISCVNSENHNQKSKNQHKPYKKRVQEENGYENECLNISSHKRFRLECNETEISQENKVIGTKNLNESCTQEVKPNYKKLTLSEKKRARKKRLKNKLLSPGKNKITKVRVSNLGLNNCAEKTVKKKSDKKILKSQISTDDDKITRAKLRRKRIKLLKSGLTSETDGSTVHKSSNSEITNTEENSTKLKKKRKHKSSQENVSEQPIDTVIPVKKKKNILENINELNKNEKVEAKKHKHNIKSVESACPSNDEVSPRKKKDVISGSIDTIESVNTVKKKHKKKHSQKIKHFDNDLYIEKSDAKVAEANGNERNIEEIITKDNENEEAKPHKKKKKKKLSLDENNVGENLDSVVNEDLSNKNTKEIPPINEGESLDGKVNKKKHKKKCFKDHYKS